MNIRINELVDSRDTVNKWMERFGVRFGVYKHGIFNEQLFPFDSIPESSPVTIGLIWRKDSVSA